MTIDTDIQIGKLYTNGTDVYKVLEVIEDTVVFYPWDGVVIGATQYNTSIDNFKTRMTLEEKLPV